jgi:hypothetical protein
MNPITAFKRRLARRLAKSSLVQNECLEYLMKHPEFLQKLGRSPELFDAILNGASDKEKSLTRIIDHPVVLARMLNSPKVFTKILGAVSVNPEVLFRLLENQNVIGSLSAQNGFLRAISNDRRLRSKVLKNVPSNERADAVLKLVSDDADVLTKLTETPQFLAAALLYRTHRDAADSDAHSDIKHALLDSIIKSLDDEAPDVILTLLDNNPTLFEHASLREKAISFLASHPDSLGKVLALYTLVPSNGSNMTERVEGLLSLVFSQPVVMHSLLTDDTLRQKLLQILQDSATASGVPLDTSKPGSGSKAVKRARDGS